MCHEGFAGFALVTLAVLSSCGPQSESVAATTLPVVDSTGFSGVESVVAIGEIPSACGAEFASRCTGTLLSSRWVLTAAHCVEGYERGAGLVVAFGEDVAARTGERNVAEVVVHPSYGQDTTWDVALLGLTESAEAEPAPTDLTLIDDTELPFELEVVGYGETRSEAEPTGLRRVGTVRVEDLSSPRLVAVPAPSVTCWGDSGGPAFLESDGQRVLVALSTSGDPGCQEVSDVLRLDAIWDDFVAPTLQRDPTRVGPPLTSDGCIPCAADDECPTGLRCMKNEGVCALPGQLAGYIGGEACSEDCDSCVQVPGDTEPCRCYRLCAGGVDPDERPMPNAVEASCTLSPAGHLNLPVFVVLCFIVVLVGRAR